MEPNPYKSPQLPSDQDSPSRGPDHDATHLLAEIRDIQLELLNMSRHAIARQRVMVRFLLGVVTVLILLAAAVLGSAFYTLRSLPTRPMPSPTMMPPR